MLRVSLRILLPQSLRCDCGLEPKKEPLQRGEANGLSLRQACSVGGCSVISDAWLASSPGILNIDHLFRTQGIYHWYMCSAGKTCVRRETGVPCFESEAIFRIASNFRVSSPLYSLTSPVRIGRTGVFDVKMAPFDYEGSGGYILPIRGAGASLRCVQFQLNIVIAPTHGRHPELYLQKRMAIRRQITCPRRK